MKKSFFTIISLIFIFLVTSNVAYASFKVDSLYIKPFSRKFSTRILFGVKELSISIKSSSKLMSKSPSVILKPNNGFIGGVGVSFRNILLSYYSNVSGTELNDSRYGKTSISDYQVNLTNRFFYISGFHRTYKGFYVSNPKESYSGWTEEMQYPKRSDIDYTTKGIETIINLNPKKYSLNASLKLTEQQLRSVFSTLLYANYSLIDVSADSSLIPFQLHDYFFEGKQLYQTNFSGWTIMPGISYNLAKSKWFFNPIFFAGLGYMKKELLFVNQGYEDYEDYYFRFNFRLNLGYNSKAFFAGTFVEWNEQFLPEKNLMIKTENFNLMFMLGYRF
ncbi:MAG: DUF4421 family protein [Bacteroidales bacterium]|nr:DUF4421 family protein [Bacteroidales bacterium]